MSFSIHRYCFDKLQFLCIDTFSELLEHESIAYRLCMKDESDNEFDFPSLSQLSGWALQLLSKPIHADSLLQCTRGLLTKCSILHCVYRLRTCTISLLQLKSLSDPSQDEAIVEEISLLLLKLTTLLHQAQSPFRTRSSQLMSKLEGIRASMFGEAFNILRDSISVSFALTLKKLGLGSSLASILGWCATNKSSLLRVSVFSAARSLILGLMGTPKGIVILDFGQFDSLVLDQNSDSINPVDVNHAQTQDNQKLNMWSIVTRALRQCVKDPNKTEDREKEGFTKIKVSNRNAQVHVLAQYPHLCSAETLSDTICICSTVYNQVLLLPLPLLRNDKKRKKEKESGFYYFIILNFNPLYSFNLELY